MATLIPAYVNDWKASRSTNEEYIRQTSWSKGSEDVKKQLLQYMDEYVDEQKVKDFILRLTNNEQLLAKATVISDGSYRTVVCHLSATEFYILGYYDFEKKYPNISVSQKEWNEFAIENSEEFFIMFNYRKTRTRLHGVYAVDIFESGESYTAQFIKEWCEHHKDFFESSSSGNAFMLYSQVWGKHTKDGFSPPNPKAYYFIEDNFRKGGYVLKRDLEKSPRKTIH